MAACITEFSYVIITIHYFFFFDCWFTVEQTLINNRIFYWALMLPNLISPLPEGIGNIHICQVTINRWNGDDCLVPGMANQLTLRWKNLSRNRGQQTFTDNREQGWHCVLMHLPCVTSECTALLSWKSGFRGVLDSGFSSCTVPTYYCRSKYFLVSIHKFRT